MYVYMWEVSVWGGVSHPPHTPTPQKHPNNAPLGADGPGGGEAQAPIPIPTTTTAPLLPRLSRLGLLKRLPPHRVPQGQHQVGAALVAGWRAAVEGQHDGLRRVQGQRARAQPGEGHGGDERVVALVRGQVGVVGGGKRGDAVGARGEGEAVEVRGGLGGGQAEAPVGVRPEAVDQRPERRLLSRLCFGG